MRILFGIRGGSNLSIRKEVKQDIGNGFNKMFKFLGRSK